MTMLGKVSMYRLMSSVAVVGTCILSCPGIGYGIPLYDVVSRGSQYRVEAVMMRVMKPLGYAAASANKTQVSNQVWPF